MKDLLKNTFPLDGKKSYGFHQPEYLFPLPGMKYSLKNTFPLYGKTALSGKKTKNGFNQQENIFLLKLIPPNFNHGFQQQKKGSEQKHTVSIRQKIKFSLAGMKNSLKNMFSLDVKVTFGGSNI